MADDLAPEGLELQPDGGGFDEEVGSEEASHLLPPIRELPQDREYLPAAFYSIQAANGTPANPPAQLGALLGQGLFQSLTDVHIFGRNADSEPWIEVGPMTPEPVQIMVSQELLPASGAALAQDDIEMFEMVAGRVAKTLKRAKQPPKEDAAAAAGRSSKLAGMKGSLAEKFGLALVGNFKLADINDCCLCLGMKRRGDGFAWFGGKATGDPIFTVSVSGAKLAQGAQGAAKKIEFSYSVAGVAQPRKVLERMFAAGYYFKKRMSGDVQMLDGTPAPDSVARGEHPKLEAAIKKVEATGLRPGHVVTKRLA